MAAMLRVALVGIDGSGKTTTAVKLVRRLRGALSVCKPGRPPLVAADGHPDTFMAEQAAAMEQRLQRADATGSRWRVMLSRRRYLRFVTRVERLMAKRFAPQLMLLTRCPYIDPAVYARFYLPRLSRVVPLACRLRMAALLSPVPRRLLYIHLHTPPEVAMERIEARLEQLNAGAESGREHWLHMHERLDVLRVLSDEMFNAVDMQFRHGSSNVLRVDNVAPRQDGVVELAAEQILRKAELHGMIQQQRPEPLELTSPAGQHWRVESAMGVCGEEVQLERLGPDGEPLSVDILVQGALPAAVWAETPGGPARLLVAYAEPSRTAVWATILDAEARVVRKPFAVADAHEHLMVSDVQGRGRIELSWSPGQGHVAARWAQYPPGEEEPSAEQGGGRVTLSEA